MAYAAQGKGQVFGTNGSPGTAITFVMYNQANSEIAGGYVTPTVNGYNLTHNADIQRTKNGEGDVDNTTGSGEFLECQFDLFPTGSSLAAARLSAQVPPLMSTVVISGADVVACGPFTDAVNVTSGGIQANRWIYEGGGSVKFANDGAAILTLTLRRYPAIAGGGALTF